MPTGPRSLLSGGLAFGYDFVVFRVLIAGELGVGSDRFLPEELLSDEVRFGFGFFSLRESRRSLV